MGLLAGGEWVDPAVASGWSESSREHSKAQVIVCACAVCYIAVRWIRDKRVPWEMALFTDGYKDILSNYCQ